jgi:hypothetical protein
MPVRYFIRSMRKIKRRPSRLHKLSKRGFQGYPIATVALYGPTAERASKVAVSVFLREGSEPDVLRRWFSVEDDVRFDPAIDAQILGFIEEHGVRSVVITDRIIGCPHEEGIDYPDGQKCPHCPYWASRDRFTHERIQ